jgi:hypothetical protein
MTLTISPTPSITRTATISPTARTYTNDLDKVIAFPNPWRKDQAGNRNRVVFENLTQQVTIRLYSVDGQLVRTITPGESSDEGRTNNPGNSGKVEWGLSTQNGSPVASGVYIYIITDTTGHEARGKIAIVR